MSPNSARIRSYRDLDVWERAVTLVIEVYVASRRLPADERFGLTAQIRRAAVSIPANVAEGHSRDTRGQYRHFISIALGSVAELETELAIAEHLGYVSATDLTSTRGNSSKLAACSRVFTGDRSRLAIRRLN